LDFVPRLDFHLIVGLPICYALWIMFAVV